MNGDFDVGLSVYFDSNKNFIDEIIEKANRAGARYIFTSLNYLKDDFSFDDFIHAIKKAQSFNLRVIIDVDKDTYNNFDFDEAKKACEIYLRMGDDMDDETILKISKSFHVVLNAALSSIDRLKHLNSLGLRAEDTMICHNFYPKPNTGLAIKRVRHMNKEFKKMGYKVISFVPGDLILRGPIHMGLPTIEEHRSMRVLRAILESVRAMCDIVIVGDIDVSNGVIDDLNALKNGYLCARGNICDECMEHIFYDRIDSSEYLIRDSSLRNKVDLSKDKISETCEFGRGDIVFTTEKFGKYFGEVEIIKKEIKSEGRVLIGQIHMADLWMLDYVDNKLGIKIVKK